MIISRASFSRSYDAIISSILFQSIVCCCVIEIDLLDWKNQNRKNARTRRRPLLQGPGKLYIHASAIGFKSDRAVFDTGPATGAAIRNYGASTLAYFYLEIAGLAFNGFQV
jgi:hypothetical protein